MAYPIEAPFGGDTYAILSRCACCEKRYDGNDSGWTTTFTTEGNTACWLLFCMNCSRKIHEVKEGGDD